MDYIDQTIEYDKKYLYSLTETELMYPQVPLQNKPAEHKIKGIIEIVLDLFLLYL